MISVGRLWVLSELKSKPRGFEYQTRFWLGLSPGSWVQVPNWGKQFQNQSILKEINSEHSLEGLMLKLQYFGRLTWRADSLKKTLMLGKNEGKRKRGWRMMKWESEVWLTEPKKELHSRERTLTVTTEYDLLKRRNVQSSQHRHWHGIKSPPKVGRTTVYILASINLYILIGSCP